MAAALRCEVAAQGSRCALFGRSMREAADAASTRARVRRGVSWDHHTAQDLFDQWWQSAPL